MGASEGAELTDVVLRTGTGQDVTLSEEAVTGLRTRLRGRLVAPSDGDYDMVRAVWNGMIDKRPADRSMRRCC